MQRLETPAEVRNRLKINCVPGHEKVYSGEFFASTPPKWAWICARCGTAGTTCTEKEPAVLDLHRFADLFEQYYDNGYFKRLVVQRGMRA